MHQNHVVPYDPIMIVNATIVVSTQNGRCRTQLLVTILKLCKTTCTITIKTFHSMVPQSYFINPKTAWWHVTWHTAIYLSHFIKRCTEGESVQPGMYNFTTLYTLSVKCNNYKKLHYLQWSQAVVMGFVWKQIEKNWVCMEYIMCIAPALRYIKQSEDI